MLLMNLRMSWKFGLMICVLSATVTGSAANSVSSATAPVPAPSLPSIRTLKLEPATLTLKDGRDERRVLVLGKTETDKWIDLTSQAAFKADSTNIEIVADGYIKPKAKGTTEIVV